MDWHNAQEYCWSKLEYTAHLVEIYDDDQNDYLAQKLDEYDHVSGWREWGIGLVNLGGKSNPRWIWSYSLQPSNFTNFYYDGTTFKDAVVMSYIFHDYDYEYKWTYVSLSHQFYPICQYIPSQPNSTTTTVAPTPNPTTSPTTTPARSTPTRPTTDPWIYTTDWWERSTTTHLTSTTRRRDNCTFDRCQNGGTCIDLDWGDYKCNCMTGFVGTNCEVDVSECAMKERRFDFWSFFGGMILVTTVVVLVAVIRSIIYHFGNKNNQFEEKILR